MKPLKNLIVVFLMSFAILVNAQEIKSDSYNGENPWIFGAKAGVNFANLAGSYDEVEWVDTVDGIIGFHAGGWANYSFDQKMALQVELLGSIQGANIKYNPIQVPGTDQYLKLEGEMRLPYIQVPILFQYKPVEKLYVEAGPQFNFLPKVNIKALVNGEEVDGDAADLISNRLKNARSFDFGLNIGAGYEFIKDWTAFARYTHGFITVDKREEDQRELLNRVVALGISYRIF